VYVVVPWSFAMQPEIGHHVRRRSSTIIYDALLQSSNRDVMNWLGKLAAKRREELEHVAQSAI